MFLKVSLDRKEIRSFLGGRQIEKVEGKGIPTYIELLAYHSNNFSKLPKMRIEGIFKSLAHDHDEAFGPYVRYYLNREIMPFEKNPGSDFGQGVIFSIYLLNYKSEDIIENEELLKDLSKAADLDDNSLDDILARKVWRSLGYRASYLITKDGSAPIKMDDLDRR